MARNFKVLLVVLVLIIIAAAAYAFAAANVVPDSNAGYAASVVGGYTVSGITYDLDPVDPTLLNNIIFTIAPTAGGGPAVTVKIQTANLGAWTTCPVAAGVATCNVGGIPVLGVTALNVVATGSSDP